MSSFNRVVVMGNLGKDPELRHTQSQKAVCSFSVATTEKKKDGNDVTEWHNIVVWDKQGESCHKYLSKGKKVLVEGRLQTRSWEDKQGVKHYTTEIVAGPFGVQFLSPKDGGNNQGSGLGLDDIPFGR